jgi:hypothetical protein
MWMQLAGCSSHPCAACAEVDEAIAAKLEPLMDHDTGELVKELHTINGQELLVTDSVELYIDRSSGMKYHFPARSSTITLFTHLYNSLSGNREMVNCHGLDSRVRGSLYRFAFEDMSQVFLQHPAVFYNGASSPLDTVMRLAASHPDRQTVFVTDGELAVKVAGQSKVDPNTAWAAKEFKEWLMSGNDLDFIVQEIPETQRPTVDSMRLFFIFFTPRAIADKQHSAIKQFLKTAHQDMRHCTHLSFPGDPFVLRQANQLEQAERKAGINSFLSDQIEVSSRHNGGNGHYTHIHVPGFKEVFDEYVTGLANKEFSSYYEDLEPKYNLEKGSILYDLWVECKSPYFKVTGYKVAVRNMEVIQEGYVDWKSCQFAKQVKDEEGITYWCHGKESACESNAPKCSPIYVIPETPSTELLAIEQEASTKAPFLNSSHLRIVPSKHFDEIQLAETNGLWIDIIPESIDFQPSATMNKLMWPDTRGPNGQVIGLHASMVQALLNQAKEMPQNPIYSYFITF